jgi:cysteine-rich repeat protein
MTKSALLPYLIFPASCLTLGACGSFVGGGDKGGSGNSSGTANSGVVTSSQSLEALEGCPNGGIELKYGIDDNGNGALETSEQDGTHKICHGTKGAGGDAGDPGTAGAKGDAGDPGAACTVIDNGDGTATISCPGGTSVSYDIPHCGNGAVEAGEGCDDDDTTPASGDGCSSTCQVEAGWTCATPGLACAQTCGDGTRQSNEVCDDGNTTNGDGCSSTCGEETGWQCVGAGACAPICGDGFLVTGRESCEDNDAVPTSNDGCSSTCQIEPGWACSEPGLACTPPGMALIPQGPFWMGCNPVQETCNIADEKPQHLVILDAFFMDRYEVTAGQYKSCVDAGACTYTGTTTENDRTYDNSKDDHPINYVIWDDATKYCAWLGKYLPTEAQWEKAAKGGCDIWATSCRENTPIYPWGNAPPSADLAMYGGGAVLLPASVGSKAQGQSPYGLLDMAGNVFEWTRDWYSPTYYATSPSANPENTTTANERSLRGGSWFLNASYLRASIRVRSAPTGAYDDSGFRCAQ